MRVALKVVKAVRKYRHAARTEVNLLQHIGAHPEASRHVITLIDHFEYNGHICMIFPKYGMSVYDFLRRNSYKGFPLVHVRELGRQLIEAVRCLHSLEIVHTDLKPENMLLVDSTFDKDENTGFRILKSPEMKLIDLGSAIFERDHHSQVITTRY